MQYAAKSPHPIDLIGPVSSSPSALSNSQNSESLQDTQNELSDSVFNVLLRKFAVVKEELYKLSCKSCSEGNFCVKLLPMIFTKEIVMGNVP